MCSRFVLLGRRPAKFPFHPGSAIPYSGTVAANRSLLKPSTSALQHFPVSISDLEPEHSFTLA